MILASATLAATTITWAPPSAATSTVVTQAWLQNALEGLTDTPRWTGTKGESDARAHLKQKLTDYGYQPVEQPFSFTDTNVAGGTAVTRRTANLIAVKQANVADPDILIVSAHYDSVPSTVGAVDNASGVAILLALAQSAAAAPSDTEVRFVAFSGEEQGLKGSAHYVSKLTDAEKPRIIGDLNLDLIGRRNTADIGVYTADGQPTLLGNLLAACSRALMGTEFKTGVDARSDHMSFAAAGIPAVMISQSHHGVEYHTSADNPSIVDYALLASVYNSVFDTISEVMSAKTTGLAQQSHQLTKTQSPSYLVSEDTVFYFGEPKALNDQRIGGAGKLERSWREPDLDWKLESYLYAARWFGLDAVLPTRMIYRVLDGDRFLTEIDLAIDEAGITGEQIADLLTERYGKPLGDANSRAWTDAFASRTFQLDTGKAGNTTLKVTDGHDKAGTVIKRFDISGGIERYQDAPAVQYRILEFVQQVVGADSRYVDRVEIWTDGLSYVLGVFRPDSSKLKKFTVQIDVNDVFDQDGNFRDRDKSLLTFVHEYGHVLTLNDSQIDPALRNPDSTVSNVESYRKDSYLAAFHSRFWEPLRQDPGWSVFGEQPTQFVDQYASTSIDEDIAESFALFVLAAKQPDKNTIAALKVNFFYAYPELVAERNRIRQAFGLDGPVATPQAAAPVAAADQAGSGRSGFGRGLGFHPDLTTLATGGAAALVALIGVVAMIVRRRRAAQAEQTLHSARRAA